MSSVTSATVSPGNRVSGGSGIHAANLAYSTLLQAGRDINLQQQEPLPTEPVTKTEIDAVRQAWVAEDTEGKEIPTAPTVLAMLDRDERVVVIAGPSGTGKTAAGLRALSELRPALPGIGGQRLRLRLEHVLPDWDFVEKDKFLLPAEHGRGYLLDVSGESARWEKPDVTARKFLGHAGTLRRRGSYLVVIVGEHGWPENDPDLGRNVVRAVSAPPGDRIARRHIEQLHPQVVRRGWLQESVPDAGERGKEVEAGDGRGRTSPLAGLLRADMQPGDAATLAAELGRISDSGGTITDARDLVLRWRERVSTVFRATQDSADDRALLLAAVMLEGLGPAEVLNGARLLLKDQKTRGIRDILTGRDLATRLDAVQAKSDGQRVTFSHLPGYPAAVLRHFWRQLSDVQPNLLSWVKQLTGPKGLGFGRIPEIADLLAQLAVDEGDLRPLDVAQAWAAAGDAGQNGAARLLARVARDPALGQEARTRLRSWAGQEPRANATISAVVCQGPFSKEYPRQALTCLRWVLGRPEHDSAVSVAEEALRTMGADTRLLPRVWDTVNRWLTEYEQPDDRNHLAARRAFLALLHPTADQPTATLLLANALDHADTADGLVRGWSAALSVPALESQCEKVLTAWAKAVANGALDADAVVEVLNHVIRENWMTGPLSTFIAGRAGTEYTSQSVVDLRERLILRWYDTRQPRPNPHDNQTVESHPPTRFEDNLTPSAETEDKA
ncbi:hypothetical protein AMK17_33565 [Streptomyces sp. CB00072]|uniref:hypothetical protein n=1 Tax=Streptomyces sp. CB00072 TaxID=1703928 RepID=UPI00093CB1D4|nr:hypothetical protein [Streptomyces sp. CB00072]OKI51197.1 hypothetical protein AMK17_33565 [Streptomyces sp. CB00072]